MNLRTQQVNTEKLDKAIGYILRRDRKRSNLLTGKAFYLKPRFIPWAKEVWVTKTDVFLPADFNEKSPKHQIMDMHRAISLFEEHGIFKDQHPHGWFITWATARKIGTIKRSLNLRIRKLWRLFLSKFLPLN